MDQQQNIVIRSIGVLTSGGDAPGMNAVVRGVVRAGSAKGLKVYGVKNGYTGLINGEFELLGKRDVSNILHRGGTFLGSDRCPEMRTPKGQREAIRSMNNIGLDALIVCGGDGTMTGGNALAEMGFPVVGIPGTIDNDVWGTSTCVGVDTALNTITEAIDKIRDTAASHSRAFIIETMGRDCGYLAVQSAIVSGGECVLIPENPISIEEVATTIENAYKRGKKHCIILMAEGYPLSLDEVVKQLDAMDLGFTARGINLSYVQRGGSPSAFDRILASRMAFTAVDWVLNGQFGVMTALQSDKMTPIPLKDVIGKHRQLNQHYMEISNVLSR
ncbi:MAG: 6-phosphofructokinase [Anaerolineaceae bacterium]|nr:6-phosphofructokinase [Anaerolineaceae bacterium]